MNIIKKYFFYRKYRWYRKDQTTLKHIKQRLLTRKAFRYIKMLEQQINLQENLIKEYDLLINTYQEKVNIIEGLQPDGTFDTVVDDIDWKVTWKLF